MLNYRADNDVYYEYYTIRKGDNLYQIAKSYNVNPSLLAALNGLDLNEFIYPNQVIMVPKKDYSYYITKDGDTLALVANTFETTQDQLLKNNETIYLREGQLIVNKNI
ncbi:MAG: LysM peptidoglycan-binding domain-containing protein [bacterium]|nr:LysM peptidoglycan-binding domain-containing protein [bacterium]